MSTREMPPAKSDAIAFMEEQTSGPMTLGRALHSIRMTEEFSQVDFAKRLGISKAHLCDIEKDRRIVGPARAARWARKIGFPPELFIELALQSMLVAEGLNFRVRVRAA